MEDEGGALPDRRLKEKEDSILFAVGYRPEGGLWRRSDMLFGRGAALQ